MTSQQRAEVLQAIAELWERYPHWRLGQLIDNAAGWADISTWDVEDEQLLTVIRAHLDALAASREQVATADR